MCSLFRILMLMLVLVRQYRQPLYIGLSVPTYQSLYIGLISCTPTFNIYILLGVCTTTFNIPHTETYYTSLSFQYTTDIQKFYKEISSKPLVYAVWLFYVQITIKYMV